MGSRHALFMTTAVIEFGTGAALLIVPTAVIRLLLGVENPSATSLVIARVVGVALLALGVAAWLRRNEQGGAQRKLLGGMLSYNLGIDLTLVAAGTLAGLSGVLLWPAVVLHAVMAVWCLRYLRLHAA